jgi:hypothetical protein
MNVVAFVSGVACGVVAVLVVIALALAAGVAKVGS